jgi:hypothetical protein
MMLLLHVKEVHVVCRPQLNVESVTTISTLSAVDRWESVVVVIERERGLCDFTNSKRVELFVFPLQLLRSALIAVGLRGC